MKKLILLLACLVLIINCSAQIVNKNLHNPKNSTETVGQSLSTTWKLDYPKPKNKDNSVKIGATVGLVGFATILTVSQFSDKNNELKSNRTSYALTMLALTGAYVSILISF